MRALLSVSDKRGIVDFARELVALDVELYSTGNTKAAIAAAGIAVHSVSELTGFPEILDGRVKTLHPSIHGAILARRDLVSHMQTLHEHKILPIDIVAVNLYPFATTIAQAGVTEAEAIEQIDIGGPAMIRASAKNHASVLPVVSPDDYAMIITALKQGEVPLAFRKGLAAKAYAHTAAYDTTIANYLTPPNKLPDALTIHVPQTRLLRYGENPHQAGALYGSFDEIFQVLHGKELSYINILDIAAVQELIEEFDRSEGVALAIVKHTNPCGVAIGATPLEAWQRAYATDREAPFGGVIALNAALDLPLAQAIDEIFSEIIIAPAFEPAALALLQQKKNRRLVIAKRPISTNQQVLVHSIPGGFLVQQPDREIPRGESWDCVTERQPNQEELMALRFAWRVVKHVKSNAIVYTASNRTLGVGAGQMSRVDSARVAVEKASRADISLLGCVMASDAFFPFPDGIETAATAGVTAIVQPGGSMRDDEVIAAANRLGVAMICTSRRHFRH
ncbi:MAG: bifunctional phosphoribosylaminoimidazolecarboxamide formyltransferase/IMP cyclohydrolase [Chloroflexales bacterium]|nr:bifunctional phosphoribosylaminoimidazolecarboxamide formyltransferase/IMP cyclohydrolase [Chloroflexales bacterium]